MGGGVEWVARQMLLPMPFFNFYIIVSMYGNEVVSSMLLCATNHRVHDSMLTFSITDYICKFFKIVHKKF